MSSPSGLAPRSGATSPRRVFAATLTVLTLTVLTLTAGLTAAPALAREIYLQGVAGKAGTFSTGPGPLGMAVNQANGVMYVVYTEPQPLGASVEKFNQTGTPADFSSLKSSKLSVGGNCENVAVDNSTEASDPNKGDFYVSNFGNEQIERYNEAGEPVGFIPFIAVSGPFQPRGMAVDAHGDLYVASYTGEGKVFAFSPTGTPLNSGNPVLVFPTPPNVAHPSPYALAFNSNGDLYVTENGFSSYQREEEGRIEEFAPEAGGVFNPTPIGTPIQAGRWDRAIAVNQRTNDVFISEYFGEVVSTYSLLREYNEQGEEIETFRYPEFFLANGVTVNEAESTVYATDFYPDAVNIFHLYHKGNVKVEVSGPGEVTAQPQGVTSPGAAAIKNCEEGEDCEGEFEEGSTLTLTATPVRRDELAYWEGCNRASGTTCEVEIGSGTSPIKAVLRLEQNTLTVSEMGTGSGTVRCGAGACAPAYSRGDFLTLNPVPAPHSVFVGWSGACANASGPCLIEHLTEDTEVTATFDQIPPTVGFPGASEIEQSTATLSAQVNPEGALTTCRFEYGATTLYGFQAPCVSDPGSGSSDVQVTAALTHLSPSTTYFFRLVATNVGGTTPGEGQIFTTASPETCATNVALCVKPSREFTIGVAKQHGASAILPVTVPGPGSVTVLGRDIEPTNDSTLAAGTPLLKLKLTKSAVKALQRANGHRLKTKVNVTFAPTGGAFAKASTIVTFQSNKR